MAAKAIESQSSIPMEYLGTDAERIAMSTTGLPVGATFYTTDAKNIYIWDGSAWCLM